MSRRRAAADWRRIKKNLNFSVAEAAELLGVSAQTVRNWIAAGLPAIRMPGLTLILGKDLRPYLQSRRRERKRPCPPGALFCFKCKDHRTPEPDCVEVQSGPGAPMLHGLCPACATLMYRRISRAAAL